MALEKPIIKAKMAVGQTFDYKPREISVGTSDVAQDFVGQDSFQSKDFRISELVAKQAGISQLQIDAQQDKINSQVLEKLKEVEQKAYEEGYELGLLEGTEKAFQDAKVAFVERLTEMESELKQIEQFKKIILVKNEAELIQLVFQVAKRIALRDLSEHRVAVKELLEEVVGEMQSNEQIVVRLSPEDMTFLQSLQDKGGKRIETLERVKLQIDESVKPGGILVESEYGTVDATVDERVERAWQALASRIPQNPNDGKA